MNGCAYCGAHPARQIGRTRACEAHDDLPAIEAARDHLMYRARTRFDGQKHSWSVDDAHAVKLLSGLVDRTLREGVAA